MPSERRLLVVTESLGVGGTESHLLRLLPRLPAFGWKVAIFCMSGRGTFASRLEDAGVEVVGAQSGASRETLLRYSAYATVASSKLYLFARRWRPDIAHFYLPGPYVIGAPVAIATRTPIKVMSRRSLSHYQKKWPTVASFERRLHRTMDALIGNSRAVADELIAEGAPATRVKLIYNGIETSETFPDRNEARRELGLGKDTLVGVIVANLIPYKGHRELVEGLAQAAEHLPSPWRILLAGRDHNVQKRLEALATKLGIAQNLQFLGERSDIPCLYAAADFGLLTSHEEGFSNVVLEGMSASLPMIVTRVGGNPEAVLHERTGLVVPPKNPRAIGEAVLRLGQDEELRKRLGAAGRIRVEQEFSIDRCVAAHVELYQEALTTVQAKTPYIRAPIGPTIAPLSRRPLMFAYWGRYGALPQFTLELAEACRRLGHGSQTTFSISMSNELFHKYDSFGDAILPVETYSTAGASLDPTGLLKLRRTLMRRLLADGTRAFVTLMPHVWSPLVAPMLRKAGIRHIVVIHDADPHLGDRTAWVNRWLLREARGADHVVTLTNSVAEGLVRLKVVPKTRISVLFHPELTYAPKIANSSGTTGPLRVLFFGRILPYKGLSTFVGAMELLKRSGLPIEIGVFGAGDLGSDRARLEHLGAEIVNRWIDPADIAGILGRYAVLVVSHTKASQSGVIAAAHGAGLPVVATPVGGLTEQIIPEVTGLIAANTSAEAVATAVRRLAEDRNLLQRVRIKIRETGGERSMERFFCELSRIAQVDAQAAPSTYPWRETVGNA
jgi:glycosyltransferase involved in cell wall biosynthesis